MIKRFCLSNDAEGCIGDDVAYYDQLNDAKRGLAKYLEIGAVDEKTKIFIITIVEAS